MHWAHDKPAYNLFELERKSSRRIIVVESTTNSPLHPFAYAHSTAAMSFLSMDALYVAHPEHLRRNWNVINLNCALPSINTLLQTGDEKPCYKATYPCVSFPTLGVFTLRDEEDMEYLAPVVAGGGDVGHDGGRGGGVEVVDPSDLDSERAIIS